MGICSYREVNRVELTRAADPDELAAFLKGDYANNLYFFTYWDIWDETCRGESAVTVLTGRKNGGLALALLISPVHSCVFAPDVRVIEEAATTPVPSPYILGRSDQVQALLNRWPAGNRRKQDYTFRRLRPAELPPADNLRSRKAAPADLPALEDFYRDNGMLVNWRARLSRILDWGCAYMVEDGGRIVSCALTTTRTGDMAMIGAVYTEKGHRRRGLARDCTVRLCRDLGQNNTGVCLFHAADEPHLDRLYGHLGFARAGKWLLAERVPDPR